MSNAKRQWPPALRQCFVAGLRFDQALQYPVRVEATRRWRNLSLKLNPKEQTLYPHEPGLRLVLRTHGICSYTARQTYAFSARTLGASGKSDWDDWLGKPPKLVACACWG